LILASGSPQRTAILGQLGIHFRVEVPDIDELSEGDPREVVVENARRKAREISARERVLGADTAVAGRGRRGGEVSARSLRSHA
jgi:septum formation protein